MIRTVVKVLIVIAAPVFVGVVSGLATLYIYHGGQGVFLPQIEGMGVVKALELLGEREIPLRVAGRVFSDEVPVNHVVSQSPPGGRRIRVGRTVSLVLSSGSREVKIPQVVGENLSRAETLIRIKGLRVGAVGRLFDPDRPIDEVLGLWPPAGETVRRGDPVTFLVSQGPRERAYAMPSLIGEPVNVALDHVRRIRLSAGRVRYIDREGALRGTVVTQVPRPGQRVLAGHRVNVEVARGSDQLVGNFSVLRYKVPTGRPRRHIRVELETNGEKQDSLDREVSAGEEIHQLIPLSGRTWARIFLDGVLVEEQDH